MTSFINITPPARRRSTSELIGEGLGQGLGSAMQTASSMYLQGKMQEMFDNKKAEQDQAMQEKSASGIAALFPKQLRPQIFSAFKQMPVSMHKEGLVTALDFLAGQEPEEMAAPQGNRQEMPQYKPQGQIQAQPQTPIEETKNLAAAQRLGIGAAPGMPGYPQGVGAAQPFMPNQQQYQPVGGMPNAMQAQPQLPQRVMAGGQVAPQPAPQSAEAAMTPERTGMVVPEAKATPTLADLSDEEFRQSLKGRPASVQKKMIQERKSEQAARRGERIATTGEEKLKFAKESFKINKADAATKNFREEMSAKARSLPYRQEALNVQRDAVLRGNFGPLSMPHLAMIFGLPESAGTDANQLMAGVKTSLFDKLSSVTGAKNVFLEKNMLNALAQVGGTKSGNLIKTDVADLDLKLDDAMINAYQEISDKYEKDPKYGYFPEKAKKEIYQKIKPIAQQLQKEYYTKFQEDREIEESDNDLANLSRNPTPTLLTQRRSDAVVARAEKELARAMKKEPTMQQVLDYAGQLLKENNYIVEK